MVETITPVVHGGRRTGWAAAAALHTSGAAVASAAFGAALGTAGRLLGAPWGPAGLWAVAGVAGLYAARELLGVRIPLPDRKQQVPEWWRQFFGPYAAAFLYGMGLGVGFLTYLRHGTLVAVAVLGFVTGDPAVAALMLAPFGLARGLTVLIAAPATSDGRLGRLMGRLDALATSPAPRLVNGIMLLTVAMSVALAAPLASWSRGSSLAAELLAGVFAWAAVAKVARFGRWRKSLAAYRLPREQALRVLVPAFEAAVPGLVLAGRPGLAGGLALLLLAAFAWAILRARRLGGDRLPCGCFGGAARRDYRLLLGRDVALGVVAASALVDSAALPGLNGVEATDVLPVLMTALGAALAALLLPGAGRSPGPRAIRSDFRHLSARSTKLGDTRARLGRWTGGSSGWRTNTG
jgi:hypothetical protein